MSKSLSQISKAQCEETQKRIEELKKEVGEIPDNTCPDIDKLIKEHNSIVNDLSYLEKNAHRYDSAEELAKDFPSSWNNEVESLAEDLRKDNDQLRNLGKTWYEFAKEQQDFLRSSHVAIIEAEIARKEGMLVPELPENIHMGRWKDTAHEGWNKAIQEDLTYLKNELEKIKNV